MQIREDIIEALKKRLGERQDIAAAYLIGSAATGQLRPDSDIDVALLPFGEKSITLQDRLDLAAKLEPIIRRTVDIGVISPGNLIYASEAILNGIPIVVNDKNYTNAMGTRLLGSYLVLREDRREVEDAYHAA